MIHLTGQNTSCEQEEIVLLIIIVIVSLCLVNKICPRLYEEGCFEIAIFIPDPKTADWPLVATPWPTVAFVAAYLFIVKVGPKIMEKREAYNLREVLIVYNFALVLLSAWMVYEVSTEVSSFAFPWSVFPTFGIQFSFPL